MRRPVCPEMIAEIAHDRRRHLLRDRVGARQLYAPTPRLAMNADAHLHLVLAERECRRPGRRNGAAGQSHPHRAGPGIDPLAQRRTAFEIYAPLGGGADDLLDNERAGHAAAASAVGRALDGDIVIGDDGGGAAAPRTSAAISKFMQSPA